jgi:hypothetical protein
MLNNKWKEFQYTIFCMLTYTVNGCTDTKIYKFQYMIFCRLTYVYDDWLDAIYMKFQYMIICMLTYTSYAQPSMVMMTFQYIVSFILTYTMLIPLKRQRSISFSTQPVPIFLSGINCMFIYITNVYYSRKQSAVSVYSLSRFLCRELLVCSLIQ